MEILRRVLARLRTAPVGRRLSLVVTAIAIAASAVVLTSGIGADEADGVGNLPTTSESARAAELIDDASESSGAADVVPVFVVIDRDGDPLDATDRRAADDLARVLIAQVGAGSDQAGPPADGSTGGSGSGSGSGSSGGAPAASGALVSDDGEAALVVVPLPGDASEADQSAAVEDLRADIDSADLPQGLRVQATGGPAFALDLANVFDGADVRLLGATAGIVALLLLLTYRSPWLWLVPLAVVAIADRVAITLVGLASTLLPFQVDGQSEGIASVLVFGAGTNYALLLIARYREELRRHDDRYDAMRSAVGRAAAPILASAGTVIVALLCLGLADSPTSRNIGYGGAIGIAVAVAYALVVLPAAMTCFGRRLFWPFVPHVGQADPTRTGLWARVAGVVTRRPVPVAVVATVALVAMAVPIGSAVVGLSQTEQFLDEPEAVTGQVVLADHFPAGSSQPATVVLPDADGDGASAARQAVEGTEGVESVEIVAEGEPAVLEAVLTAPVASDAALRTIEDVRGSLADAGGTLDGVLVGGPDAEALDAADAADRDQWLIIPVILAVVLVVLLVLLRSVVAALVLVATVVGTLLASLGVSWLLFEHVLGFPALDVSVPLLASLFLVALGVDYNIFLTTRAKEEAENGADAGGAISVALAATGGVITSAGILLAAVFAVLGVLPLIVLAQIGVIVGFGVLLDTLVVRGLLVPALVTLLGRWFWWPGHLWRDAAPGGPADSSTGAGSPIGTGAEDGTAQR